MKITCNTCNQDINANMYFCRADILGEADEKFRIRLHKAIVLGKCICTQCGSIIDKWFETILTDEAITELAISSYRKEQNNDGE